MYYHVWWTTEYRKAALLDNYPLPQGERVRVRGLDSNESPSSFSSPLWGEESLEKISPSAKEILGTPHFPAYAKASAGRRVGNNKYKEL
jgi:hypothetical protein